MIIKEALSSENHERVGFGHETTLRSAQTMPNCCWIQSCTISIPECPRNYGGSRSCKIHSISKISMVAHVSTNRTQLPCTSRFLEDTPTLVAKWCSTGGICRPVCTNRLWSIMVLLDRLRVHPRIATSVGSMYSVLATVYSYINGKHDPRGLTLIWSLHSSYITILKYGYALGHVVCSCS